MQARPRQRAGRRPVLPLVLSLVAGLLAGCTPGPPDPDEVAHALAAGIEARDLGDVPLSGATAAEAEAQITTALAGLDPLRPTVEVGEIVVDEKGTSATAALDVAWDLDAGELDWTYTTTANLDLVEDQWQARWTPFLIAPDLLATETLSTRRERAVRGTVLGAQGAVLVELRPVLRLGLDKTHIEATEHDAAARQIAVVLGLDQEVFAAAVAGAGEKAFVEAMVVRVGDPSVDLVAFQGTPGALAVPDELPLAPTRRFARPVLGTAGPATAEIVEASQGAVVAGDLTGLSGLQRQYDEQLRGRPGLTVVATAGGTAAERILFTLDPTPGEPLVTTIDPALQELAETTLEPVGPASGLVALRPSTGEVLAAASGAGGEGYSTATLGTFAPGSVFKLASSLALLRSGLTPDSPIDCPPTTTVDGRAFTNFPDYPEAATGQITLRTAVAHSCNTAFIGAGEQLEQAALADAAASLGLGVEADLGFPAFLGTVPAEAVGTEHAASMIGQGQIQVSPLAMATAAASVGAGRTVTPWLVGTQAPTAPAPATPLTAAEAEALRTMLRGVVTEGGAQFLLDVPGPEILAKTGTAQYASDGETRNHAWMVAVQGDLAVAVFVADGDYGSTTAGPLLKTFLTAAQG